MPQPPCRLPWSLRQFAIAVAFASGMSAAGGALAAPLLLVEADSGRVLHQEDATRTWYPASVTKLMTAYVALQLMRDGRARPETLMTISADAEAVQPSKMGFKAGTQVTLENGLRMLMVKSANDIAIAIAETLGGSIDGFAAMMNGYARRVGMTHSSFVNPHGLPDPAQYTTARDMAMLARALIREFPQASDLFNIPAIRLGKIRMRNHNLLIHRYAGADGMKTGFICSSGFNVVATAIRGNKRLIAVVFGANSSYERAEVAAGLFDRGFAPSFNLFAAAPPQLSELQNDGGDAIDMREQVCGKNRKRPSEDDFDPAVASNSANDPDGIYATQRTDRANGTPSTNGAPARQSALGAMTVREPVIVYVGPSRGDTMLAGIAPRAAPAATVVVAQPQPAPGAPRQISPTAQTANAGMAPTVGQAAAFAPASPSGGLRASAGPAPAVPMPRPRPRR